MALELGFISEVTAYSPVDDSPITASSTAVLSGNIERDLCYWKVPRGVKYRLPTLITKLQMKLKDSSGNDLPDLTNVALAIKSPLSKDSPQKVVEFYYRPWKALTLKEQLDDTYADRVTVSINLRNVYYIELPEDWELHFLVKLPKGTSDTTFSFGNSVLVLPVEEARA